MNQRQQFARTVTDLMDADPKIVLILADIGVHSFREAFERHPTRCFNTGCAEQASVSLAAGLAKSGLYPIFSTIASFMCRRAYEQIYVGFGINELKGLFVSVGAEGYPGLGPTHECPEDYILMSYVPDMKIAIPITTEHANMLIRNTVHYKSLGYVRLANT